MKISACSHFICYYKCNVLCVSSILPTLTLSFAFLSHQTQCVSVQSGAEPFQALQKPRSYTNCIDFLPGFAAKVQLK